MAVATQLPLGQGSHIVQKSLNLRILSCGAQSANGTLEETKRDGANDMPLKITPRREEDVPPPGRTGKSNEDFTAVRDEMRRLGPGMVIEIDAGTEKAVRSTKMLVTRAAKDLGTTWRHWSAGSKVFAMPAEAGRRRTRRKTT